MTRLRVLLLEHDANAGTHKQAITEAFAGQFDLTCHSLDRYWPARLTDIVDSGDFDAVIWKAKFRQLNQHEAFDWGKYQGIRVLFDLDTIQNYSSIVGHTFLGAWPRVFRRDRFDLLVSTGRELTWRLNDEGIPTAWIPKGFDDRRVSSGPLVRDAAFCTYGDEYLVRRRMMAAIVASGVPIARIACEYEQLAHELHRFAACIICNMELRGARFTPLRVLELVPQFIRLERVGMEPMIKNFEAAGAGCVPVCDDIVELEALGFESGVTMLPYRSFGELRSLLAEYSERPGILSGMGQAAARLVHSRHTWRHRAALLDAELRARLGLRESAAPAEPAGTTGRQPAKS